MAPPSSPLLADPELQRRGVRRWLPIRTFVGFALALVALVAIAVLSVRAQRQHSESRAQVLHTMEVLASAQQVLSLFKDAETGQRGYLLSHDSHYLNPYQQAVQALGPALSHLRQLTGEEPPQQERLARIDTLAQQKLAELDTTLSFAIAGDDRTALQLVRTDQGKHLMDSLRQLLGEVEQEEQQRLARRIERLNQVARHTMLIVLGGIGLLGALTLLAAGIASRDFQALARAAWERRRYEERLLALHAIDKAILRAASPMEVIRSALTALRRVVGCARVDLLLMEPGQAQARLLSCDETQEALWEELVPGSSPLVTRELAEPGVPQDLARLPESSRGARAHAELLERGLRYEVRLPLHSTEQRAGSLGLVSRTAESLDARAVQMAREVADQVSIALEQTRLRQRLQGEAERLEQQVRVRTAELHEANAELEAFSYSVSHDLRAPLRAIDGFSQAVEDDSGNVLTERSRRFFLKVKTASGRMAELIDDLLNLSRLSRAEMNLERVDLSQLAGELLADLRASEPERPVEVSVQPGLWTVGDRRLLRVALENLLGNAWKFTRRQPHPHIEVMGVEHAGQPAFSIRDNGAGFDMDYAQKLFSPFQRMHSEQEFPGTGVGLAIVQRIVRRHGGRIWAESAVGQGTTLFFTLGGSSDVR